MRQQIICERRRWLLCLLVSISSLSIMGCSPSVSPRKVVPTDGLGAERYWDPALEMWAIDAGLRGYKRLKADIASTTDEQVLACQLGAIGLFQRQYKEQGAACEERLEEIRNLLSKLLLSSDKSVVRAAVTHIYYDYDLMDDRDIELRKIIEGLANDDDHYIARFASLSLPAHEAAEERKGAK